MNQDIFFIGVDVGSGSVRAALVDQKGSVIRSSVKTLKTWNPSPGYYEQSSDDVWQCCEYVIKVKLNRYFLTGFKRGGYQLWCYFGVCYPILKLIINKF